MNYSDIQIMAKEKRFSINTLAAQIEMTAKGLKYSLENETLPADKIKKLCKALEITPSQFFSEESMKIEHGHQIIANNKVNGNISADSINGSSPVNERLLAIIEKQQETIQNLSEALKK